MKWFTAQNGNQVDIHERVEDRELTVACNVMPQYANLIASTPNLLELCQLAAEEIYHLTSELGDDPNTVGCYTRLTQAIAKAAD